MATVVLDGHPEALEGQWVTRRNRADELAQRRPYAAEVLGFYSALLAVQQRAYEDALADPPGLQNVATYAADRVLPPVIELSIERGPAALSSAVLANFHEMELTGTLVAWLRGDDVPAIERFLARASIGPVLEALAPRCHPELVEGAATITPLGAAPRDDRHCPACNGLPQVAYFAASPEDLVTAHRYLTCSRCATSWPYPRLTCASCGETDTAKLLVYAERGTAQGELTANVVKPGAPAAGATTAEFPHIRIDGCRSCSHYLLTIDLERDRRAVPLVDEIAAIPLDLYAKERGLTKLVPNLMGI
jgi:formate dehydrogenase maturation protein FdhE